MSQYRGLLGVAAVLCACYALSRDRKRISARLVLVSLALLFLIALLPASAPMEWLAKIVTGLLLFSEDGISLVWGNLANTSGSWGFVFAIKILPVIVFFSAFMAILYHFRVMQGLVLIVSRIIRLVGGNAVSGMEAVVAAANVFIGQTEAPLIIKPYIARMTRSQIMSMMTCGFATISCTVLGLYAGFLSGDDEGAKMLFTKHLLTANLMSAVAALMLAKMLVPETEARQPDDTIDASSIQSSANVIEAAAIGATKGIGLAVNIAAMLVAFGALIAMADWALHAVGDLFGGSWNLESLLGATFGPFVWLFGLEPELGSFLGKELIVTEFIAFKDLGETRLFDPNYLSPRSYEVGAYALCSFANIPSIGVQIGGLTAIAPERRRDFASLGVPAMVAGLLASCLTAGIASLFI